MVILVSSKGVEYMPPCQDATRSGSELVPAAVRNAGPKAVESFLCFFAHVKKPSLPLHHAAAKHFFGWCQDASLSLDALRSGHVQAFLAAKEKEWKGSTAALYFGGLRRLFAHLEADRIVERSPFVGVEPPKPKKSRTQREDVPYEAVCKPFCKQWGNDQNEELTQAAMVMIAPACIASFDVKAIQAWSKLPVSTIDGIIDRLYGAGIWFKDNSIRCEWLDPECEHPDFAMLMDAFVVVGRFDRDDQMRYSLPKERYEQLKAEGG